MATERFIPVERSEGSSSVIPDDADHFEETVDDLLDLVLDELAALAQGEGDVFANAERVEEGPVLEDHGDFAADGLHLLFVVATDVFAGDVDLTGIGLEEAHDVLEGDGLCRHRCGRGCRGFHRV